MKLSTGLRNYILATGSLKAALAGGEIRFYQGTVPADADAACGTPTPVVVIKNAGAGINFDTAAAAGILAKAPAETWSGTNAASATVTYFRHVLSADANDASASAIRIQGTLATAGADVNISNPALTSGATQTLPNYTVAQPAG